jgi:translocation and assembly module TamB
VVASVSGTAYEPQIDLGAEPPMSQADILSTIIFGRPTSALNAGETRQLSAQALALMGQGGRREIERLLGPTLAPDVVTVHNEMQTGSSLEAGKYLSPDLYLRYRQNMDREGGQTVGLELKLKPYLSLDSQLSTTRDNGVDVIFSFDFD